MVNTVIFVPNGAHMFMYADQCMTHAAANGYHITGLVTGDWGKAAGYVARGVAGVLLVARREHLDPHREPRVELALPGSALTGPDVREVSGSMLRRRRPNQLF